MEDVILFQVRKDPCHEGSCHGRVTVDVTEACTDDRGREAEQLFDTEIHIKCSMVGGRNFVEAVNPGSADCWEK